MAGALHAVEATGVGRWMRESLWAYPSTEAVHIVGLALLFGSIAIVDLRLLGLGRRIALGALSEFVVPWTLGGFLIAATTGLMMFSAHATEFITQPVFVLKMGLILTAGINAAVLHSGPIRRMAASDADGTTPGSIRFAAALSLALWIGVIACGRLLAYL